MSDEEKWEFLFELQWWNRGQLVQRYHAWATPEAANGVFLWEQALTLYYLQQAYARLLKAQRVELAQRRRLRAVP